MLLSLYISILKPILFNFIYYVVHYTVYTVPLTVSKINISVLNDYIKYHKLIKNIMTPF